jgi:hypothetical protein
MKYKSLIIYESLNTCTWKREKKRTTLAKLLKY